MHHTYHLTNTQGDEYESSTPGNYAGWRQGRIFGTLTCTSGARKIKAENRVFFADLETAVRAGYRPCQHCHPLEEKEFKRLKRQVPESLLPETTLEEFYRRHTPRRTR